jgi:hypothetical protein
MRTRLFERTGRADPRRHETSSAAAVKRRDIAVPMTAITPGGGFRAQSGADLRKP